MQAVAYVRVSTEEQVSGTSLDSQVKACKDYAKAHGLTLSDNDVFREEGESAKFANRPQLIRMLDACKAHKSTTHCIVWKVDRLARDFKIHAAIKVQLAKYEVKLVSVTEPISDDPMGQAMEGILAVFSQLDNDVRTLRTTGGMRARTMQGGWPHSSPVGYKTTKTPSGITTLAPSDMADVVTGLLNEFSTGAYTVKQAATLAFNRGIKSRKGKKLYWQSIHNIIANPIYMGWIKTKYTDGEMVKGLHPALISERTFYKNQAILSGNTHNCSREAVEDWPLRSGFLKHPCGSPMTGSSPRGRSGPSPRYSCPTCKARQIGRRTSKMRNVVHDEFMELLAGVRPAPGAQRLFKEIALRQWNNEFKQGLELSSKLEYEMSELMQKKSRVIDLYIDGKLTDEEKQAKLAEIESNANKLRLQTIDAEEYVADKEQVIDGALLFMSNPDKFWDQSGLEIKKRVQDSIFPEGLVYDCVDGFGIAKLSESYLIIMKIADESAKNPTLVETSLSKWNQIKAELMEMYKIIEASRCMPLYSSKGKE